MKRIRASIVIALVIILMAPSLEAVVIKIGSIAPSRSPWDKALQEIAREWERISEGNVEVRIYPGGIAGTEADMIRKIRLGVLQGGVFTNMGINRIVRSVLSLNMPFLFTSQEEFEFVFDRIRSAFEADIEKNGFKIVMWTLAGWVHFFSKEPVLYPEDLQKHKLAVTSSDPQLEQIWKKMGYQVVPTDQNNLMVSLQSGMVTAAYLPALVAGSGQFFALVRHMMSLTLSPLVGGLLLGDRVWRSIPEQYHEPMLEAVRKAAQNLYSETMDLENEALETMKGNGLVINNPPEDALEKWRTAAALGIEELVGTTFSKDIYDRILKAIEEFRKSGGK